MAGPFGAGGAGFPPPTGFPPPNGFPPLAGGIVVHRARVLPRLAMVAGLMGISFLVTGLVIWFSVFSAADEVARGSRGGARVTERGAEAEIADDVSLPQGWPTSLTPPADATIVTSVASGTGTSDAQLVLVVEVADDAIGVADALRAQLAAAGLATTTDALGADGTGSITASGAGWEAAVSVAPVPTRPGTTKVSWVLRAGPR